MVVVTQYTSGGHAGDYRAQAILQYDTGHTVLIIAVIYFFRVHSAVVRKLIVNKGLAAVEHG